MPETLAGRLRPRLESQNALPDQKFFPVRYSTARSLVKRLWGTMSVKIRPHDLRRHSVTSASRNGMPLEVISKVHYGTRISRSHGCTMSGSAAEALSWMDVLHGK